MMLKYGMQPGASTFKSSEYISKERKQNTQECFKTKEIAYYILPFVLQSLKVKQQN